MSTRRRLSAVPDAARRWLHYVRVSALMGRGGEDFHSPELQSAATRDLMGRHGGVEVEVVQDIDRTGKTFAREGIDRIFVLARDGLIDVVAVYDLSRFGRNTEESLRNIRELKKLGVSVVSSKEQIDDSPEGQFMLVQFLALAELYGRQVGRRWSEIIAKRARQGLWHGSNPPVGYQLVKGAGLVVDPVLGPLLTAAFERYAAGHLVSHIARDVGDRRGKVMPVSMMKRAFRNPVYVGRLQVEGALVEARHEALVDEVTWERVQRRLERDARTPARRLAVSHSLVGLVVCDECSHHLQLHTQPGKPGQGPRGGGGRWRRGVLQCRRRLQGGEGACRGPGTPPVLDVEQAVRDQLPALIERLQVSPAERAEKQARRSRAGVDVERLRRELGKTEAALARLTVDLARRDITQAAYRLASADLEASAGALRAQIDDAQHIAESPSSRATIRQAKALLEVWDAATVPELNRSLRALLREVRVRRAAYYREPIADRVEVIPIS